MRISKQAWGPAVALILLTGTVYLRVWHAGFIWDDDDYVTQNSTLHTWQGLHDIWFKIGAVPQYYPLVHTTFWIERHLWGLDPLGYHLVNVALHAMAAVLFWRVLVLLKVPGAWLAAAIFALHPVAVESVAWVTERKNVLSAVFYFGAALMYLRFFERTDAGATGRRRWLPYFCALIFFAAALLSKTVTCTLPAALLLVRWWRNGRLRRTDVLLLVPFFVMSVGFGILTAWMERHHVGAEGAEWNLTLLDRCLLAGRALWFYAGKLIWPNNLIFIYPRWVIDAAVWWQWLFPLAAIAVVALLWLGRNRLGRGPLVAVLFFAGTLGPALGFVNVYPFRFSFVADHFQYLASVGLIALAGAGMATLMDSLGDRHAPVRVIVSALLLGGLGLLTWRQQAMYHDMETLFRTTIERNPGCWMAHNNLGSLLVERNEIDEALLHFQKALEAKPDLVDADNNMANALLQKGEVDKAIEFYRKAIAIKPTYAEAYNNLGSAWLQKGDVKKAIVQFQKAVELKPNYVTAGYNLGSTLLQAGRVDEAIDRFRKTLEVKQDYPECHNNLGLALMKKGKVDEAIAQYEEATKIKPDFAEAYNNLGSAALQKGKLDEGIRHYEKAIEVKPTYAEAYYNLGCVLAQKGEVNKAIKALEEAVKIKPGFAEAHNNLGSVLLGQKKLDEAIVHFRKALEIKSDYAEAENNLGLALQREGKPAEAVSHYEKALENKADYAEAHYNLGTALLQIGRKEEAFGQFEKAIALQSSNAALRNDLAWLLATSENEAQRNGDKAVEFAKEADQLDGGNNPSTLDTLAAAYAERGDFKAAEETGNRALELARKAGNEALGKQIEERIELYRQGRPYREGSK